MPIAVPWFVMLAWLTYQHGFKQNKLPEPYYFLGATAAMSIASLVSMFNKTIGSMLAWGLVIAVFVAPLKLPSVPAQSEKQLGTAKKKKA